MLQQTLYKQSLTDAIAMFTHMMTSISLVREQFDLWFDMFDAMIHAPMSQAGATTILDHTTLTEIAKSCFDCTMSQVKLP
jgi:hypothetical protein